MEKVFIFKAKGINGLYGFTKNQNGKNLPTSVVEKNNILWHPFTEIMVEENEAPRIGINTEEMLEEIERNGFYLRNVSIKIEIKQQ